MPGIDYPLWFTLKDNIKTILETIATEETIIDSARNFSVEKDRWRPWIEEQQSVPLVNIMVQTVGINRPRSSNRRSTLDDVTVNIDMYALGEAGEVLPPDEIAAKRLDLLIAQVREGLTRLAQTDFGFEKDSEFGFPIDRENADFSLTYYDQENEQSTGQYAPARWTLIVQLAFIPTDNNTYNALTELNVSLEDLTDFSLKFTY
ncbi:hypothetical protein LCGC14_1669390 [marine sediment metagenome]|uniref:Uncharacterized protein n=1 Tax=marine sediment metagenome TaxID=412755 RepID=A0A0F9HRR7_9ZZZZ